MAFKQRCLKILVSLGLVCVVLGGVLIFVFHAVIKHMVESQEVISEGSTVFNDWVVPPADISMQFFVFGIANHEQLKKDPDAKVELQQLGPFAYKEHRQKVDITFWNNGKKVSYREIRWFEFDEKASGRWKESDKIWTLNIALVGISQALERFLKDGHLLEDLSALLIKAAGDGDLFVQKTVGEVIWGYEDPLLRLLKPFLKVVTGKDFDDHIGLFYGKNGTDDGVYEIHTGKGDSEQFAIINKWNNMKILNYWENQYANSLNGTDGTMFPPFLDTDRIPYFFSTDICRSIYATYEKTITLKGVTLYHFVPPPEVFADIYTNPDNIGFCTPDAAHCLPAGTLNLTLCQQGQPAVASLPHFYQGDASLSVKFNGLRPRKEKHQTFIDIEPTTGVVMNVAKRLQVNLYLKSVHGFPSLKGWDPVIFPLMWINESVALPTNLANDVKSTLYKPVLLTQVIQYLLISVGGILLVLALMLGLYIIRKSDRQGERQPLVRTDEDTDFAASM